MLSNKTAWDLNKDATMFTSKLLLMDSPTIVLLLWLSYMIFILKLGPHIMRNRPAYNLNNLLTAYNAIQVLLSSYIVYTGVPILWKYGLKPKCLDNKDDSIGYLTVFHHYYMLKIIELLDTVFFVLRKKFSQASFLHVYHHSYMVISTWFIVRYEPTYAMLFPGAMNSVVHIVMYSYYGLSAFPALAKYLWWKKYITTMQLVQFVILILHLLRSFYTSDCPPSFLTTYSMNANCTLFIILFIRFYIKSYKSKKREVTSPVLNCVGENSEMDDIQNSSGEKLSKTDGVEISKTLNCVKENCEVANGLNCKNGKQKIN